MIISDQFQFVFVHIPKCGGTSVRSSLAKFDERNHIYYSRGRSPHEDLGFLDYPHIPLAVLRDYFREDFECVRRYASFALTRDPFARFPSSLSERVYWRGRTPQELTSREVAFEVDEVIEYLKAKDLKLPLTEPDFIHFGRQVDYVRLDGKDLVNYIYPLERLPDMLRHLEEFTGTEIVRPQRKGERFLYNNKTLHFVGDTAYRAITNTMPSTIYRAAFDSIKTYLFKKQLIIKWTELHANIFQSTKVKQFVSEFYADDILLHEDIRRKSN